MIFYSPGNYLIVNNFSNGILDKEQYNIDLNSFIIVESTYDKGKITKVRDNRLM